MIANVIRPILYWCLPDTNYKKFSTSGTSCSYVNSDVKELTGLPGCNYDAELKDELRRWLQESFEYSLKANENTELVTGQQWHRKM